MTKQLFILGDSISMGYGPTLAHYLGDTLTVERKQADDPAIMELPDPEGKLRNANGTDSGAVLAFLRAKLAAADFKPDVLLLNCGLHDLKTDPLTGQKQVAPDDYRANLAAICQLVKDVIPLTVWVRTTPVDDALHNSVQNEFHRYQADVKRYNAIAEEVMQAAGYPIIDLHGFTQKLIPIFLEESDFRENIDIYVDHVHFAERVENLQAAYIAGCLTTLIAR